MIAILICSHYCGLSVRNTRHAEQYGGVCVCVFLPACLLRVRAYVCVSVFLPCVLLCVDNELTVCLPSSRSISFSLCLGLEGTPTVICRTSEDFVLGQSNLLPLNIYHLSFSSLPFFLYLMYILWLYSRLSPLPYEDNASCQITPVTLCLASQPALTSWNNISFR